MELEKANNSATETNAVINAAFRAILDNTRDMMFVKNTDLVYVAVSMPFVNMVGKEQAGEIIGRTDHEIFDDVNLAKRYVSDDRKLLTEGENLIDYIEPIADDNGQPRYGSTSKYILSDPDGKVFGILGITRDITKDYMARQHYQKELKYLFELPADTYAVSYIDVDSWRVISQRRQLINEGTLQTCYTVEELCEGAVSSIVDEESDAVEFYRNFTPSHLRSIYESGRSYLSYKYQRALSDGSMHWVHNEIRFLTDVDSGHLCAMLSAKNIDKEKYEEQKLVIAAKWDKMTMVLNRETTMEYIRNVFRDSPDRQHALFMIDVDNFKKLNDTWGHQAGDEFLINLAAALKNSFRESDIVGRIGGDEFFALMRDIPGSSTVERKARELLAVIQRVCEDYSGISLSASIGIGMYSENGKTLEELYSQADSALYQAKGKGKNQFVFATV